jgi:hypothetical protein
VLNAEDCTDTETEFQNCVCLASKSCRKITRLQLLYTSPVCTKYLFEDFGLSKGMEAFNTQTLQGKGTGDKTQIKNQHTLFS